MAGRRGNGEGSIYQRTSTDGRWCGSISMGHNEHGKLVRKVVTAKTRAEVVKKLKALQRQLDDGLPLPDMTMTVAVLLERWYEDVLRHQVAESAALGYMSVARHHIMPTLGRKKLAALTTSEIDRLLSSKIDSGLAVSTVRRIRSVLAQAIDQGIRWGVVNRNVATLSRAPRAQRVEGRTLTPEQAHRFLSELEGHRNEALYALMLSVGLRRGEALGLRWDDLNERTGVLQVRRQLKRETTGLVVADTKTARSRRAINLPRPMLKMLKAHRAKQASERLALGEAWIDSGFIFTTSFGSPLDPRNLLREFKTVCERAGLGNWHLHELRHSAASLMLAMGVPLQVVSEVLGHASIRMTADVYGHILAPDRQAAADAMSSLLWSGDQVR
jgi:integrase